MNDILYSPWRLQYIIGEKEKRCIFCLPEDTAQDSRHLVIHRTRHSFVIMNMYPYNNGHLLVVPLRHVSKLDELSAEESRDLFELVQRTVKVLETAYQPDGMNLGMNLGKAGGAGIEQHLHMHIVPRWEGDLNFMTAIAGTRVIPEKFEQAFKRLQEQFDKSDD
ncbi:MAG: HIT domain-containing protein [Candidatus Cloacimonetes bacterium]|nr:HIT domain-containing protein [Candidatus Cloacimonadota bacterium]